MSTRNAPLAAPSLTTNTKPCSGWDLTTRAFCRRVATVRTFARAPSSTR